MKTFEPHMKMGIQGDVAFTRITEDDLPEGLVPVEAENGQVVVAHSETGHNHAFDEGTNVAVLQDPADELVAYIKVGGDTPLKHHRSFDTHETVKFTPGIYRINRQREYTPEGWRRVAD